MIFELTNPSVPRTRAQCWRVDGPVIACSYPRNANRPKGPLMNARQRRWRPVVVAIPALVIVLAGGAAISLSGAPSNVSDSSLGANSDEPHEHPYTIPGYASCTAGSAGCDRVAINLDFYARLTGDTSVRYPADMHLPVCPTATFDPGLTSPDSVDPSIDSAPECAVPPSEKVTWIFLTASADKAFQKRYSCGNSMATACAKADLT